MKTRLAIPATLPALLPQAAHAQNVPVGWALAALSPLLVLVLAVALGVLARSWRLAALHAGLVVLWVVLFAVVAQTVENDYVVWTPIVLYAVHGLLVLGLVFARIAARLGLRRPR